MIRNRLTRPGITLIEMMVAMALSLGIMLILTESFKMALDFVRGANSTGEMIYQLNGAGVIITRDLQAEHFRAEATKPNNGVRLSDQRLDWAGNVGWTPPTGGFFKIYAPYPGVETIDAQGFLINAPATNHVLHFTSVLPGGNEQNLFTTISGGVYYTSRAAEIAYFLVPTGTTSNQAGGQQLYNLVRRYRLVALTPDEKPALDWGANDPSVISVGGAGAVNTMATVTNPGNRLLPPGNAYPRGVAPAPPGDFRYGEDLVLSHVLSFEVTADWTPNPGPYTTVGPRPFPGNTDAPYDFLPNVFDTANPAPLPPYGPPACFVQIKSLQIVIRVYDPRMKQTRQNTLKIKM